MRQDWLSSSSYEKILAILTVFELEENPKTIQYRGSQVCLFVCLFVLNNRTYLSIRISHRDLVKKFLKGTVLCSRSKGSDKSAPPAICLSSQPYEDTCSTFPNSWVSSEYCLKTTDQNQSLCSTKSAQLVSVRIGRAKRGIIHCPASHSMSENLGKEGRGKTLPHVIFAHCFFRISMVIGFY